MFPVCALLGGDQDTIAAWHTVCSVEYVLLGSCALLAVAACLYCCRVPWWFLWNLPFLLQHSQSNQPLDACQNGPMLQSYMTALWLVGLLPGRAHTMFVTNTLTHPMSPQPPIPPNKNLWQPSQDEAGGTWHSTNTSLWMFLTQQCGHVQRMRSARLHL